MWMWLVHRLQRARCKTEREQALAGKGSRGWAWLGCTAKCCRLRAFVVQVRYVDHMHLVPPVWLCRYLTPHGRMLYLRKALESYKALFKDMDTALEAKWWPMVQAKLARQQEQEEQARLRQQRQQRQQRGKQH